eukprot:scpid84981/ scgid21000/ 
MHHHHASVDVISVTHNHHTYTSYAPQYQMSFVLLIPDSDFRSASQTGKIASMIDRVHRAPGTCQDQGEIINRNMRSFVDMVETRKERELKLSETILGAMADSLVLDDGRPLSSLKVNDLKAELSARRLPQKGVKAVLSDRLYDAIIKEREGLPKDGSAQPVAVAEGQEQPERQAEEATDEPMTVEEEPPKAAEDTATPMPVEEE